MQRVVLKADGWLLDYHEQGMESQFIPMFQDARFAENRSEGWEREGLYTLMPGDHLVVRDEDGKVLFEGTLVKRRRGLLYQAKMLAPPWLSGVSYTRWHGWLKARLPATLSRT